MSTGPGEDHPRELVIIKRRAHGEGEGHHGGVWKIAYADFMTAMMAFFLVMWLINAANEETRSQVASYFNPVKLIDSRTNTKGLQDLQTGAQGKAKQQPTYDAAPGKPGAAASGEQSSGEDGLKEPTSEPLAPAGPASEDAYAEEPNAGALEHEGGRQGNRGGEAYLDPFDPQSWQQIASERAAGQDAAQPALHTAQPESKPAAPVEEKKAPASPPPAVSQAAEAVQPSQKPVEKIAGENKPEAGGKAKPVAEGEAKSAGKPLPEGSDDAEKKAQQLERDIKDALGEDAPGVSPQIEVRGTKEGVLISLTDSASFGMFDIASAEPQPVLIRYMEEIGKVLKERGGTIVISGHTDGRPFRTETNDNWKLSSARAQMAFYMLVRGGVDERRIEKIEGHADRDLKVPGDPEAAENRRIEILLRESKS